MIETTSSTSDNELRREVLAEALDRSLENLKIERARFDPLPMRMRKLSLLEALHRLSKSLIHETDFFEDRCNFNSKKISDFSLDQIREHQTIVDLLISLVCLGETEFLRSLVPYLSFPEPRWSIIIEPVLRAVTGYELERPIYRIPQDSAIANWMKLAIEQPIEKNMTPDLEIFQREISNDYRSWIVHDIKPVSSLVTFFNSEIEKKGCNFIYEKQTDFCSRILYPQLESRDYGDFALVLDRFLKDDPYEGDYHTLIACAKDYVDLKESNEKRIWDKLRSAVLEVSFDRLSSVTVAVLFWILQGSEQPKENTKLVNRFIKKMVGKEFGYAPQEPKLQAIRYILMQNEVEDAVTNISKSYIHLEPENARIDKRLKELNNISYRFVSHYLIEMLAYELDSICIVGSGEPKLQRELRPRLRSIFNKDDKLLSTLAKSKDSTESDWRNLGLFINELYALRGNMQECLAGNEPLDLTLYISNYKSMLNDCYRRVNQQDME